MAKPEGYGVSAQSYLERAKICLLENRKAALFYAAWELRCCIEARQDLYLEAQEKYARSVPARHKIGAQGKALEGIFSSTQIQALSFFDRDRHLIDVYHVPVTKELRKAAERISELLHAQVWHAPDDQWWLESRRKVVKLYRLAWICCQGALLSPVFREPEQDKLLGRVVLAVENEEVGAFAEEMKNDVVTTVKVDYLTEPPADWVCDVRS